MGVGGDFLRVKTWKTSLINPLEILLQSVSLSEYARCGTSTPSVSTVCPSLVMSVRVALQVSSPWKHRPQTPDDRWHCSTLKAQTLAYLIDLLQSGEILSVPFSLLHGWWKSMWKALCIGISCVQWVTFSSSVPMLTSLNSFGHAERTHLTQNKMFLYVSKFWNFSCGTVN